MAIIFKLLGTTTGTFTFSIFALVFVLVKVPQLPLVQWFNERKSKRLKFFQDHFSLITDDKFCKTVVEDVRNAIVFEHATRIYAEQSWRKGLVELHDNAGVPWIAIKRAHRLMDIRLDGTVFIKEYTLFDKFDRIFNIFMAIFFSLSVFFLIVGLIYKPGILSNLQALVFCLFSLSIATFSVIQNFPYYAADRLRNKLDLISQSC